VQKVAIQSVGSEPGERAFASRYRPILRSISRHDLGDQKNLIAPPGDGIAYDVFGLAVVFRSVDMVHAEIQSPAQSSYRGGTVASFEVPSSLTNHRDPAVGGTK
jgi:hypothetical protein